MVWGVLLGSAGIVSRGKPLSSVAFAAIVNHPTTALPWLSSGQLDELLVMALKLAIASLVREFRSNSIKN
jgi:hypothetical protein